MNSKVLHIVLIVLMTCFNIYVKAGYTDIIISEYCAVNDSVIEDETGSSPDWIELYNSGTEPVNLSGMYLTDNPADLLKWKIPSGDLILQPDSFLLLWADNKPYLGITHLGFKLSSAETIELRTPTAEYVDSVTIENIFADISVGRINSYPDSTWVYYDTPTPGSANTGNYFHGLSASPKFSVESGFYNNILQVEISSPDAENTIYYTINGHDPLPGDTGTYLYSVPVSISQTTVLRALSMKVGFMPCRIVSAVYFFGENPSLDVMATITDPDNLTGPLGIYSHPWNEGYAWERFSQHILFKDQQPVFMANSGLRIQGGNSVGMAKKSFRQHYRDQYGNDRFTYPIFAENGLNSYKNIVLRAGYDDDITTSAGTLLRDPLSTEIWRSLGSLTSYSDFVALYLNTNYWGIYNIKESVDEDFFFDHLGTENLDVIRYLKEGPVLLYGDLIEWDELRAIFSATDFSIDDSYYAISEIIDMKNFIDLLAFTHCSAYRSWTWGSFIFKESAAGSKWRWTIWDSDRSYTEINWNGFTDYAITTAEKWSNFMPKELIKNRIFRNTLINRTADMLNSVFRPENVIVTLDSLKAIIEPEMPAELERWNPGSGWNAKIQGVKDFLTNRPAIVRNQIKAYFSIPSEHLLTLDAAGKGCIRLNSLQIDTFPWNGIYFETIPVYLKAIPAPGYKFTGWSNRTKDNIIPSYMLDGDSALTAIFEEDIATEDPEIIINEIMYNSAPFALSDDWVELYNAGNSADLSGWRLTDANAANRFTIPDGTYLTTGNYLVVTRNTNQFRTVCGGTAETIGDLPYGLSGSGDCVKLYNADSMPIDSVCYDDNYPWPSLADGYGSSLQLTAPLLDNSLPGNWQASLYPPFTPGKENAISFIPLDIENVYNGNENTVNLRIYPVPVTKLAYFSFILLQPETINISIYTISGSLMETCFQATLTEGPHIFEWDSEYLSSGIYYVKLTTVSGTYTTKIIKIK